MKTSVVTVTILTFGTLLTLADPGVIIRERAKELRDQNNVRQGVAAPVAPNQPQAAPAGPAAPTLSPGLVRFNTDVATIRADAAVTAEQKQKLAQELISGAQGARPSLASANKLIADVSAALAEKPLSPASRARFIQELDAMLNPAKYPQANVEGILKDVQAIFQENGLPRIRAMMISEDVKKLRDDIQKGGG